MEEKVAKNQLKTSIQGNKDPQAENPYQKTKHSSKDLLRLDNKYITDHAACLNSDGSLNHRTLKIKSLFEEKTLPRKPQFFMISKPQSTPFKPIFPHF